MKGKRKNQGIITVFVLLIMVPTVVITGTMVDLARLKMCSSQAAMAADAYGEVVLSEYDNLLKELYGLFSVTQTKEGLEAVKELAEYTNYSFVPDGGDMELGKVFMPYKSSESKITYSNVTGATLENHNVLMTQISDFMKFRVVEEVLNETNILGALKGFDKMAADMDVVEKRNDITTDSTEVLGKIDEYFRVLKVLNEYPSYISERETAFKNYSEALYGVYNSDGYRAYAEYMKNRETIDAAKAKVEAYEAYLASLENLGEGEEAPEPLPTPTLEEVAWAEKYVDAAAYQAELNTIFSGWPDKASLTEKPIAFGDVKEKIKEIKRITKDIEDTLDDLKEKVDSLTAKLPECSKDMRDGVQEEIAGLEKIVELSGRFTYTTNLVTAVHDVTEQDNQNKEHWEEEIELLEEVQEALFNGTQEEKNWANTIQFEWFSFRSDSRASELYTELEKIYDGDGASDKPSKDKADKEIDRADTARADAEKQLEGDEPTDARNIDPALAVQLGNTTDTGEVPDLMDCFSGGASFSSIGNSIIGKFLTVTYDFGMFSSRVSGIKPPEEEETQETEGEYYDESLTGIKMSREVNYLYKAEIEYIIGGHNDSVKNLNHTRNIICGTRMALNYVSTYSIDTIDTAIKTIAETAAGIATASVVAAAAAPLIKVAVSGALRAAVAAMETVSDWKDLTNREEVIFYKRKMEDLTTDFDGLKNFLGISDGADSGTDSDTDKDLDFKLSYEDYTYILMCLFVDEDTLLDRTSDLITLNVNQSQQKAEKLSALNFKMADTVTAVKSTCEIKFDFVIVPDNFLNLFIPNGSTKDTMQKLENGSYAYTMIRSY